MSMGSSLHTSIQESLKYSFSLIVIKSIILFTLHDRLHKIYITDERQ